MIYTNYHSHTFHSDGKYGPEDYIQKAIDLGLKAYGFSDHAPVDFENTWSIKSSEYKNYLSDIQLIKDKYSNQIDVYLSMEVDYIPGVITPTNDFIKSLKLDYTVGSVHYVGFYDDGRPFAVDGLHTKFLKGLEEIYDNNVQEVVTQYFALQREMVTLAKPDVVGHCDKIRLRSEDGNLFSEEANWYKDAVRATLETFKSAEVIVEINTRAIYKKKQAYPYPNKWILEQMKELDIPIQVNSDCHHPREIALEFDETAALLRSIGFDAVRVLLDDQWKDVAL